MALQICPGDMHVRRQSAGQTAHKHVVGEASAYRIAGSPHHAMQQMLGCRQPCMTLMPGQVQLDRGRKWTERRTPWPDMQGFLTSQVILCQRTRWLTNTLSRAIANAAASTALLNA